MWKEELKKIDQDSIHGASYLTKRVIEILCGLKDEELKEAIAHAKKIQPMMAPIYNFVYDMQLYGKSVCETWWKEFEVANEAIKKKALSFLCDKIILTHSFSTLVYETLKSVRVKKVICTVSEPKKEGLELAKKLCKQHIDVEVIIDAAVGLKVVEADLVLIGADGIGKFGLVHKIGTYPLALSANDQGKRVYVLAPRKKFWPSDYTLPNEARKESKEVAQGCFTVDNRYFDITPLDFLTLITD